jgi:hypothetical protein
VKPLQFYIWDLETFPNCFLFTGKFEDGQIFTFEISDRVNHRNELLQHLSYIQTLGVHMVGYNSLSFDYPVIHELLVNPYTFDATKAHHMATNIINSQTYGQNPNAIRLSDRIIPQIDLVKINHFDNANKRVSLKTLQFSMRAESVEDLPFEIRNLTFDEMDVLRHYNVHDVNETERFLKKCKYMIDMRKELLDHGVLTGDVLNYSDVKIGTEILIKRIGRHKCFISGSKPRQTLRSQVAFKDIILPKIEFRTDVFKEVHDWFNGQTLYIGKEAARPSLERTLAGLQFHFGIGGLHASVESKRYASNETHVIKDIDVSGMYPAVAIANGFYPEHLGQDFVTAYRQLQVDRKQYPKGSAMNLVLKLASNGVYGNSNNPYSCFYDPKYTFSVTVNGQLQLLQLAEMLSLIPGVELIQANTDGITAYVPKEHEKFFDLWCNEWEAVTGLKLEYAEYSKMFIRDVNNYLAVTTDGKIKRKGAYWWPVTESDYQGSSGSNWNKDFSTMVVQKATEACLVHGLKPEEVVYLFTDPFDFMLRAKTTGGAKLYIGDVPQPKTVRYYISKNGQSMKKVAKPTGEIGAYKRKSKLTDEYFNRILSEIPPGTWDERIHSKNKAKYAMSVTSVESGWLVKNCNRAEHFDWKDLNYEYYIDEIRKLII